MSDPERKRRFAQEAKAASALNHPNIITIYDIDQAGLEGRPTDFIAMEFVPGQALDQLIPRKGLRLIEALKYAIQVADALAAAHAAGIVHRDLKPGNVMVSENGCVKVLDFGLAKLTEQGGTSEFERTESLAHPETKEGAIVGTASYMSPEQAEGKKVDARTDIFSFGAVLYEIITGRRAFVGDSMASILSSILRDEPQSAAEIAYGIPHELDRIVTRCLQKDPNRRYQHAGDLKIDLQQVEEELTAGGSTIREEMPGRRSVDRWWWLAATVTLLAVTGAWWLGRQSGSAMPAKFQRLTFPRGIVQGARFAPDGRSVIYSASWEGQPLELFSVQPDTPESPRPLGFPSTGLLSIAPTGEMAVCTNCRVGLLLKSTGTLAQMPLAGGAPREILENVGAADWTRDGKQLAVSILRSNGNPSRLEFPIGKVLFEAAGTGWPGDPRVSSKGDLVAFADHYYYGDDGFVAVVDLQGHKKTLTRKFSSLQGLAWSPNGEEIWFAGSTEGGLRAIYAVTLSGRLRMVAQTPDNLKLQDMASDGRLLLTRNDERRSAYFLGPGNSVPRELTWLDWAIVPRLSQDGQRLLMTEGGYGARGKSLIYLRGTDGSPAVRLGAELTGHSLSPDGKWVAALTDDQVPVRLVLLPVKAGKPVPIETGSLELGSGTGVHILWSPDSQRILIPATEPGRRIRAFVKDINGGPPHPMTPEGIRPAVLTADGTTLLAFDAKRKAFLYPLDGGPPRPVPFLSQDYNALSFSADGRSLYVTKPSEHPPKVSRLDLATGRIQNWRELLYIDPTGSTTVSNLQITPDGKSLAYIVARAMSELCLVEGLK
jgi:eukaryotic-like serine/threonine-protein kinase